jgi:hypothetical protein
MPTTKPRYTITDSGELRDQLDQAQLRWPGIRDRKELLLKLVAFGRDAIEPEATDPAWAAEGTSGALSGVYGPANWSDNAKIGSSQDRLSQHPDSRHLDKSPALLRVSAPLPDR